MNTGRESGTAHSRGKPRSADADQSIVTAAVDLLAERDTRP